MSEDEIQYQVLQGNWIHNPTVEAWLRKIKIGRTLNVCSGMSFVGDVRLDIDPSTNRTEAGDLFNLPFAPLSFDTVICDPPFSYYNRFGWVGNLASIARKRLLLSIDRTIVRLPRAAWSPRFFGFQMQKSAHDSYLRIYYCYDRNNRVVPPEATNSTIGGTTAAEEGRA